MHQYQVLLPLGDISSNETKPTITLSTYLPHNNESNKIRYCPQESQLIASKGSNGEVYVYNWTNYNKGGTTIKLIGNQKEGFGLSWNTLSKGLLLSCGSDGLICMWDLSNATQNTLYMNPSLTFLNSGVEDICWHKHDKHRFGAVNMGKLFSLYDIRCSSVLSAVVCHGSNATCIDFNPLNEYLVATGGGDNKSNIWDLRNLTRPLSTLKYHKGGVFLVIR